ncbi:MAG: hypothetical protein IRY99_17085 [Isosphaeraceae bacterium]|nr:hypothetical protein [Isosphaeraceae bacterium]
MPPIRSDLPIINNPEPFERRTMADRYGSFYYLGLAGLVVLVGLVAWFGYQIWSLRGVWANIYVLNDPRRPEAERVNAAWALSRDPRVTPRQRWDLCLSRTPPDLGRYLLAESLTSTAVEADPSAYAKAVAYSEGWPIWLRLLLVRPLAYAAGEGERLPNAPLDALRHHHDPIIALWATYARSFSQGHTGEALAELRRAAEPGGPHRELAALLLEARQARQPDRNAILDRASLWLRTHHPDALRLWQGWEERDGRLVRRSAPDLRG